MSNGDDKYAHCKHSETVDSQRFILTDRRVSAAGTGHRPATGHSEFR